jgi:hypothetical protein
VENCIEEISFFNQQESSKVFFDSSESTEELFRRDFNADPFSGKDEAY